MVFDKTGTLTEDGLEILGVRGTVADKDNQASNEFLDFKPSIRDLVEQKSQVTQDNIMDQEVMLNESMACCHSITYVNG